MGALVLLFAFAGVLVNSFVLQLFATLKPGGVLKRVLLDYSNFWYFVMDTGITLLLISALLLLSLLPLLRLQSLILFNRDFAKVIASKLRRAELLKRILS